MGKKELLRTEQTFKRLKYPDQGPLIKVDRIIHIIFTDDVILKQDTCPHFQLTFQIF